MALRGESGTKSEDFCLYCSLCMESYGSGRSPKLLPCFHTFCLPCLVTLTERAETGNPEPDEKDGEGDEVAESDEENAATDEAGSEDVDAKNEEDDRSDDKGDKTSEGKARKKFRCPTCRTQVTVPSKGLSALQTNFYLPTETELATERRAPLCEMCEEGEGKEEAQHFCHHCQQRMCRACRRLHDRVVGVRDHRVEPLSSATSPHRLGPAFGKKMCQFHPDQLLCFHCGECDVTICLHCKLTSHEGHDTQDMATAAVHAKAEMASLHARADQQLLLLESCISRLERDEMDVERQKKELEQQVARRYEQLLAWALRAHDELLEEVAAKEQASLSQIRTKKASASFFRGNITSKKMRASQTLSLGADLVLVKNELQGALLKEEAVEEHRRLAERREHLNFFSYVAGSSVLELPLVQAYMGELLDSATDSSDTPSLSFHDLASAVSRMKETLQGVQDDLLEMKDEKPKARVELHATMTANYNVNTNQKVLFNNILSNEGDGYSSSTGIFTAPVEGCYMFITTVRNAANGYAYSAALMVRGSEWGRTTSPESSCAHCVVRLKEGEQVWVQPYANFECMANATMFCGVLVSA